MGSIIFRPSAHTDTFVKWLTESNAYNGDYETSAAVLSANLAHADATGSLILYGFPSSAAYNLTSLTLYGMYNVDNKVSDDEFGLQASEDSGSNYNKTLLAMGVHTSEGVPFTPNMSVALSTSINVSQCYVRVNLDMKKSADGATLNLFEIWAVGAYEDEIVVEPAGATGALTAADPDVEIVGGGEEVFPTGASGTLTAANPTVVKASIDITPTAASGGLLAANPTTIKGTVTIEPSTAPGALSAADPTVVLASITISPTGASGSLSAADPVVVLASIVISPSGASGALSAADPVIAIFTIYEYEVQSSLTRSEEQANDWTAGDDFRIEQ